MRIFKSYDIRGVYPTEIDAVLARKIGVALGQHFREFPEHRGKDGGHLVVGRDMRASAKEMCDALIDGLRTAGHRVTDIGMVSTPCSYFAIQRLRADGGVVCTASHNPPQYTGFKVSRELAIPIGYDAGLKDVERRLNEPPLGGARGGLASYDVDEEYVDFLVGMTGGMKPLHVAVDASNGMAGKYVPWLFQKLPCTLEGLYLEPDGTFPHHEADPLKPKNLADVRRLVRNSGAAVGLCLDGDGDRLGVVDEKGDIVPCDLIAALLAQAALRTHPGRVVAYDLRSSRVVPEVIVAAGGTPLRCRVGHAHAKRVMREHRAVFGGELSGHYYFELTDRATFYADSGLIALVSLLNVLSTASKPLSELIAPLRKYFHSGEINFEIDDKDAALAAVRQTFAYGQQDDLDGVTVQYADWWFNARASNTEPLLRLTLEGNTPAARDAGYEKVSAVLNRFGRRAE